MNKVFLVLLTSGLIFVATSKNYAQIQGHPSAENIYGSGAGMRISDLAAPPKSLGDAVYLSPEWKEGSILLENGQAVKKCTLRCDLGNKLVEIKYKDAVRAVQFNELVQFNVTEETGESVWYYSGSRYLLNGKKAEGVYEMLVYGDESLLLKTSVQIVKGSGGFTDARRGEDGIQTVRSEKFYSVSSDSQLTEIKGMGSLVKACGEHGSKVKSWAKQNNKNPNKKKDLSAIWTYYLSLTAS